MDYREMAQEAEKLTKDPKVFAPCGCTHGEAGWGHRAICPIWGIVSKPEPQQSRAEWEAKGGPKWK